MKLFLSYSHTDDPQKVLCHQVCSCLASDFEVWFDEAGLRVGNYWWNDIRQEIAQSKAFICFLSKNWLDSFYCQQELDIALREGKRIFPIILEEIDQSQLHPRLNRIQFLSAIDRAPDGLFTTNTIVTLLREINSLKPSGLTLFAQATVYNPSVLIFPPELEWCEIPQGQVTIKYDPFSEKSFPVSAFCISKYPVTNVQYQTFLLNGYEQRDWWHYSEHAYRWRLQHDKPIEIGDEDCPCVNVSWYDAIAFCRWLSHQYKDKLAISLPTETQWQRAAGGDEDRVYPWGNEFDQNRCNTLESGIGKPTFVTHYKNGISPYGVYNMSGNVWEWCLNDYRTPRYTNTHDSVPRALRGGSWADDSELAKTTARTFNSPDHRSEKIGFRLAYSI